MSLAERVQWKAVVVYMAIIQRVSGYIISAQVYGASSKLQTLINQM